MSQDPQYERVGYKCEDCGYESDKEFPSGKIALLFIAHAKDRDCDPANCVVIR